MDARQQAALAPFVLGRARVEAAAQGKALRLERRQRRAQRQAERAGECRFAHRTQPFQPAAHDFDQRLLAGQRLPMTLRRGDRRRRRQIRPQRAEGRQPFGRDPDAPAGQLGRGGASFPGQPIEQV